MINDLIKVQVSGVRESAKSIGALINLKFDEEGNCTSASDLFWFPKSICELIEEDYSRNWYGKTITSKRWFVTAPKWFLEKNSINFQK